MNRRNFLQHLGTSSLLITPLLMPWQNVTASVTGKTEQAAIIPVDTGVLTALGKGITWAGGIGSIVFKKSRVVVKPAMAWDRKPGTGYNSDPEVVRRIIDLCYKAGAREVSVFDHTIDEWTICYKNSGIERAAKDASARVLPANDLRYFKPDMVSGPSARQPMLVHHAALNADIIINVAVARTQPDGLITAGINNLTGCIWDRKSCLEDQVKRCVGPLLLICNPQLTITEVWTTDSTRGGENTPHASRHLIVSPNTVTADQATAIHLRRKSKEIWGLSEAISFGHGKLNLPENHIRYLS
jgi:uncharacterized protein (DUF362 family)